MISRIQFGDARSSEAHGEEPVHLVVTSPPYWTIKDYNATSQIGHGDGYEAYLEPFGEDSCGGFGPGAYMYPSYCGFGWLGEGCYNGCGNDNYPGFVCR